MEDKCFPEGSNAAFGPCALHPFPSFSPVTPQHSPIRRYLWPTIDILFNSIYNCHFDQPLSFTVFPQHPPPIIITPRYSLFRLRQSLPNAPCLVSVNHSVSVISSPTLPGDLYSVSVTHSPTLLDNPSTASVTPQHSPSLPVPFLSLTPQHSPTVPVPLPLLPNTPRHSLYCFRYSSTLPVTPCSVSVTYSPTLLSLPDPFRFCHSLPNTPRQSLYRIRYSSALPVTPCSVSVTHSPTLLSLPDLFRHSFHNTPHHSLYCFRHSLPNSPCHSLYVPFRSLTPQRSPAIPVPFRHSQYHFRCSLPSSPCSVFRRYLANFVNLYCASHVFLSRRHLSPVTVSAYSCTFNIGANTTFCYTASFCDGNKATITVTESINVFPCS